MPSTPNQAEGEEYKEHEDEEEGDDDEEYDPESEALNATVAASLEAEAAAEAEVVEDSSEVEIIEAGPNQEDRDQEIEEEEEEKDENNDEEEQGKFALGGSKLDQAAAWPNCTICLDPWTSDGPHRVCCIPCGHVYGNSCLEKWLRCRKSAGKCPQCSKEFKANEIINIYAPLIVVPNDDLEKEVLSLREDNEILKLENSRLQEKIRKQKYLQLRQMREQLRQMRQRHEQMRLMRQQQMQPMQKQIQEQMHILEQLQQSQVVQQQTQVVQQSQVVQQQTQVVQQQILQALQAINLQ